MLPDQYSLLGFRKTSPFLNAPRPEVVEYWQMLPLTHRFPRIPTALLVPWVLSVLLVLSPRSLHAQSFQVEINFLTPGLPEGAQNDIRDLLENAHARIAPLGPEAGRETINVEWAPDLDSFKQSVRLPPEHTMAAARAEERLIIINGENFNRADPFERQVTITHEYAHLFLGTHCPSRLPLWLEEGLAMHLSGDQSYASDFRLVLDNSFGVLTPLVDLRHGFPSEPKARSTAYRQAYSVTAYVLRKEYSGQGARDLVRALIDPKHGDWFIDQFWDAMSTNALEVQWRQTISSIWAWLLFITSGTFLWGAISALFIVAYIRRRRKTTQKIREWEAEDAWMESLPAEDCGGED
jgi:hypothetical protein